MTNDPAAYLNQWAVSKIGLAAALKLAQGQGITIAVVDTLVMPGPPGPGRQVRPGRGPGRRHRRGEHGV